MTSMLTVLPDSAGRFFANHLLKLLLAQIVLRYDIKPDTKPRPQNPVSGTDLTSRSTSCDGC